ncbi:MAG: type III-B CRISPR module RAMP protein Cmr6 [Chitinophagales bacterium]|nr:type III-B CRISPR module RAMP protein Cmr6 [Chitinophagales bacterium]
MSLHNQVNLGWHFYQNYFVNNDDSLMNLTVDELKKDSTEEIFKKKNKEITQNSYDISYFKSGTSSFDLYTAYPGLLLGSGYGHEVSAKGEFKLGFFFDYTTGLPIIPGSSIKGVLRSVFPDFKEDKLKNEIDKVRVAWLIGLLNNINDPDFLKKHYEPASLTKVTDEEIKKWINITLEIFEGVKDSAATKPKDKFYSIYERDIFHDAVLKFAGKDNLIVGEDALAPHVKDNMTYEQSMLHNPVPLPFLKVLPQVGFSFHFDVKNSSLDSKLTKDKKILLFQKILLTIGIGAKTNVGYGQFTNELIKIEQKEAPQQTTRTEHQQQQGGNSKRRPPEKFESKSKYERRAEQVAAQDQSKVIHNTTNYPEANESMMNSIDATIVEVKSGTIVVSPHYKDSENISIQGKTDKKKGEVIKIKPTEKSGKAEKGNLKFIKAALIK